MSTTHAPDGTPYVWSGEFRAYQNRPTRRLEEALHTVRTIARHIFGLTVTVAAVVAIGWVVFSGAIPAALAPVREAIAEVMISQVQPAQSIDDHLRAAIGDVP